MHPKYEIAGVRNTEAGSSAAYTHPFLMLGTLQDQFSAITKKITQWVVLGKARSVIRFGDGDFNFLMRWEKGSAKPGNRGTTIPYSQIDSAKHRYGFFQNDVIALELQYWYRRRYLFYLFIQQPFWNRLFWKDLFFAPGRALRFLVRHYSLAFQCVFGPSLVFDVVYSLVGSRWLFKTFPGQVGIIANEHKVDLIKNLISHKPYQDYLGTGSFTDYVAIPQKGAADDTEKLAREILKQIKNSPAKIFLLGVGHAKADLIWRLKQEKNAVFLDVGVGIDAIAGCVCQERPYFADWVNYRLKDYDYEKVDQMDYNKPFWDKSKYKTVWL